MVITKSRTDTTNWATWHQGLLGGTEQSRYVNLNTTAADDTYTNYWGTGGFTSSVFGVSNNAFHNNSNSMIAYCFAEKKDIQNLEDTKEMDQQTGHLSIQGLNLLGL